MLLLSILLSIPPTMAKGDDTPVKTTGTVTDPSGEPLPGATVKVKGSNIVTVTDVNGNFSVSIPANSTIEVSYIGYSPVTMKTGAVATPLTISLQEADHTPD